MIYVAELLAYLVIGGFVTGFLARSKRLPRIDGAEWLLGIIGWPVMGAFAFGVYLYESHEKEEEGEEDEAE